ncbi:MAG: ATP-binding cassette domain-containing protein [Pseudomonadota bacterium]
MSLILSEVSVSPPGAPALFAPISLTITAGQIGVVTGPSGIGKSTLLDAVGGHLARGFTLHGAITLNGADLTGRPAEARRVGLMFQEAHLFAHLSVGANLAFGLNRDVKGRAARRTRVEAALAHAGLDGFHDRDPATLSGGQRARAALMRALLAEPRALLLDEPFAALDVERRAEIRQFVFDHIRQTAIPALLVTHDEGDAAAAGGPVVTL